MIGKMKKYNLKLNCTKLKPELMLLKIKCNQMLDFMHNKSLNYSQ